MIRVLTVEREYGSGGAVIAAKLAERLGWKLWDQLLTDEIARVLECDCGAVEKHEERKDPLYYRLFKAFLRGSFEGSLNVPRMKMVDTDCVREVAERIVTAAARAGQCVIVGRGSAYYLHGLAGTFHVFIYAPLEEKVRRLRKTGKGEAEAIELAESVDRDRAAFIKQYFGAEWPAARSMFHLMVNSAMGDEAAVETILTTMAMVERPSVSGRA
jgi:cytidylate kinase